jgi:hypothetical protein
MKQIKTAYSLIRFSNPEQILGDSRRRQIDRCKAESERRGWQFDESLTIDVHGISAHKGEQRKTGALSQFIQKAKEGQLGHSPILFLENLDRYSRERLSVAEDALWELIEFGVDVFILSSGIELTKGDKDDPQKRYFILAEFHRANQESVRKSYLVNEAFTTKYKNASEGKPVQMGYWQPTWIDFIGEPKQIGQFQKNKLAPLVQGIAKDYLGGKSMLAIANDLNSKQIECIGRGKKKGKQWSQGQIAYLLKTETLLGHLTIKDQTFKNYYPPLIKQEEWDLLQLQIVDNKTRKSGSRKGQWIANLFRGRVVCSKCGGSISTQYSKNKSSDIVTYYYKCSNARLNKDNCQVRKMVPVSELEWNFFSSWLKDAPTALIQKPDPQYEKEVAKIKRLQRENQKAIDDAGKLIGVMDVSDLRPILAKLKATKESLVNDHERITNQHLKTSAIPESLQNIKHLLGAISAPKHKDHKKAVIDFGTGFKAVYKQLENREVREQLVKHLPAIVSKVEIDLNEKQYRIIDSLLKVSRWHTT